MGLICLSRLEESTRSTKSRSRPRLHGNLPLMLLTISCLARPVVAPVAAYICEQVPDVATGGGHDAAAAATAVCDDVSATDAGILWRPTFYPPQGFVPPPQFGNPMMMGNPYGRRYTKNISI